MPTRSTLVLPKSREHRFADEVTMSHAAAPSRAALLATTLLTLLLSPALAAAEGYQWTRQKEESGCVLETSVVPGKRYIAAKATCTVHAKLHDIGDILRDIPAYPRWMHDCTSTTMLKVLDAEHDTYLFWYRQHIPVLADRDMVLKSVVQRTEVENREVYSIVASSTDEATYDARKGYVRMPSFTSEWRLEELDAEHTRVSFMIDPDLGGGLPAGLATPRIAQMPFRSIQGLLRVLQERHQLLGLAPRR